MSDKPPEPYTDRLAFADILTWSADQPAWQRDALRRILENGGNPLSDTDLDACAVICHDATQPSVPLDASHLPAASPSGQPVALLSIGDTTGINALAPGQTLAFAAAGLTIVYGDNGSGKSGYVRVLKHACRSRDDKRPILRDVQDTAATPQMARIKFNRGGVAGEHDWTPSTDHPDLPSISIFDARSASIHVEETNAVAYNPYPMQVLALLADACDAVKARLSDQVDDLRGQTPASLSKPTLPETTAAGNFIRTLTAKTNPKITEQLVKLSDADHKRLAELEADLSQDPKVAAAKLKALLMRVETVAAVIQSAMKETSDGAFRERDALAAERDARIAASSLASDALFAAAPLPDVGGETWRALWEAARKYSDLVAYPAKHFPASQTTDDLCVLCQQPLSEEAIQRQQTFEEFVKSTTKADEAKAVADYRAFLVRKRSAVGSVQRRTILSLFRDEVGDEALANDLRRCAVIADWRLRSFRGQKSAPSALPPFPKVAVDKVVADLQARLARLTADDNDPVRKAALAELAELRARRDLAVIAADVTAHIERLKKIAELEKAMKAAAKRAVTIKNKEISDRLVTDVLRGRFSREIEKLKLARMPVELKKIKDETGKSFFRVCLVERPKENVGQIFSEGEHRCVALAAFMAELVTSDQKSAIVFDDPMSSLDHIHRRAVAVRLVEEAEHRQVIVFTHDLTFLYELRREAEGRGQQVSFQTVHRKLDRPGHIEGDLPTKGKSAMQLIQTLRSDLKDAKGQFATLPESKRTRLAKGFIEQLREGWDQGVADFIFPVLGRFENTIKTTSIFKLAVLTEADVIAVMAARARLSEELHLVAEALNPEQVGHAELVTEVDQLQKWLEDIAARQKTATKPVLSAVS